MSTSSKISGVAAIVLALQMVTTAASAGCDDATYKEYEATVRKRWYDATSFLHKAMANWISPTTRKFDHKSQDPGYCAAQLDLAKSELAVAAYVFKHKCFDATPGLWLDRAEEDQKKANEDGCRIRLNRPAFLKGLKDVTARDRCEGMKAHPGSIQSGDDSWCYWHVLVPHCEKLTDAEHNVCINAPPNYYNYK